MFKTLFALFTFVFLSFTHAATNDNTLPDVPVTLPDMKVDAATIFEQNLTETYQSVGLAGSGLSMEVFRNAYTGFLNMKNNNMLNAKKDILTIIDFGKKSTEKRLWIIDLKTNKVLHNTLVSHGRNTGGNIAKQFSNTPNSYMSSIGFYVTNETYFGKHGLSLRLDGKDPEFNSNARDRAIVMHGADYATGAFVKQAGRLGRSLGCPALPSDISANVIELIKDNTLLYIHAPNQNYSSAFLDTAPVLENLLQAQTAGTEQNI